MNMNTIVNYAIVSERGKGGMMFASVIVLDDMLLRTYMDIHTPENHLHLQLIGTAPGAMTSMSLLDRRPHQIT